MASNIKLVSLSMTIIILFLSLPIPAAQGAMIETIAILDASQDRRTRNHLKQILTRKAVQDRLAAWGIFPLEAAAYIDSLTEVDIKRIIVQIEYPPIQN